MYAVIQSGGKQYRVELGNEIEVDRLDVEPGQVIELAPVLLVADGEEAEIGRPSVDGASVSAKVLRQDRGDKVVVFKYKPKARTRVKKGARAELTILRIADIAWAGRSAAKEDEIAAAERQRAAEAAEKAAAKQAAADRSLAEQLAAAAAPPAPETPKAKRSRPAARAAKTDAPAAESTGTNASSATPPRTGGADQAPKRARTRAPKKDE